MTIMEVVFLHGCPCCMDNKPAIVTLMLHEPHAKHTQYLGVTDNEIKALQKYGSMNIMACKRIDDGEEE